MVRQDVVSGRPFRRPLSDGYGAVGDRAGLYTFTAAESDWSEVGQPKGREKEPVLEAAEVWGAV